LATTAGPKLLGLLIVFVLVIVLLALGPDALRTSLGIMVVGTVVCAGAIIVG
jgi:hypothetical protein